MREQIHVVGIGGGNGLSGLLSGLRELGEREQRRCSLRVTAIVSVADDGGSTGRLRRTLGIPAVGDLRRCLAALAGGEPLWPEIFQHRFCCGDGLGGHALGNLVLAAMVERCGGLQAAMDQLAKPLQIRGRVLAVTEQPVSLIAERSGGEVVSGESRIPHAGERIDRLWLSPPAPAPTAGVLEAIADADALVLGPGSVFTSILPNLLVAGVAHAIRRAGGLRILACNLMTQPGETDGFAAAEHVEVLLRHLGPRSLDVCLADDSPIVVGEPSDAPAAGSEAVRWDPDRVSAAGVVPVVARLRADGGRADRHDPLRLAAAVLALVRARRDTNERPAPAPRRLAAELGRAAAAAILSGGTP